MPKTYQQKSWIGCFFGFSILCPVSTTAAVAPPVSPPPVAVVPSLPSVRALPVEVRDVATFDRIVADDRTSAGARLVNISVRARLKLNEPLCMGFVIGGSAPRTVLLRASGGGLRAFGITETAVIPVLDLYDSAGRLVFSQSGTFYPAVFAAMARVGAYPAGLRYTAVVMTLPPGAYRAMVWDLTSGYPLPVMPGLDLPRSDGFALAEIYDIAGAADARLMNFSSLGGNTTDEGGAIAGFVLGGTEARSLLVRGIGPGLAQFGVPAPAQAPALAVRDSRGATVATSDGPQGGEIESMAARVGAFPVPRGGGDAIVGVTLERGAYTVQIDSRDKRQGTLLLEIYDAP